MTRQEIYNECEKFIGFVPDFVKRLPDKGLEAAWVEFRTAEMEPGLIPPKYKHLLGLAVASALRTPYDIAYHTELAKVSGASEDEIMEAISYTKMTVGWAAFFHGAQVELDEFKKVIKKMVEHAEKEAHTGQRVSI